MIRKNKEKVDKPIITLRSPRALFFEENYQGLDSLLKTQLATLKNMTQPASIRKRVNIKIRRRRRLE